MPEPMVIALLRAERGGHPDDDRPIADTAELLQSGAPRRPRRDENARKKVRNADRASWASSHQSSPCPRPRSQYVNRTPNSITLPGAALVTCPKPPVGLPAASKRTVVFRPVKETILSTLNDSARSCSFARGPR